MKSMKRLLTFILSLTLIIGSSSLVCAWTHNENHPTNDTGANAYDVVKILEGDYEITEMHHNPFPDTSYRHRAVGGNIETVLRWEGAMVPPGGQALVCFTAVPLGNSQAHASIKAAFWTDEYSVPLGPITAVSVNVIFNPAGANNQFIPLVEFANMQVLKIEPDRQYPDESWKQRWNTGHFKLVDNAVKALDIREVKFAIIPGGLTPENLTVENTIKGPNASLYKSLGRFNIQYDQTIPVELGVVVPKGYSVVIVADLGEGQYDLYNFPARGATPDPGAEVGCFGPVRGDFNDDANVNIFDLQKEIGIILGF